MGMLKTIKRNLEKQQQLTKDEEQFVVKFSMLILVLVNSQRAGVAQKMRLFEYQLMTDRDKLMILKHKTGYKQPAIVPVEEEDQIWLHIYAKHIRPNRYPFYFLSKQNPIY